MNGVVVVDASLAIKWLVSEENSDKARAISRSWANAGIQAAAPYLMPVEVTNALHRRVVQGELTVEDATRLLGIPTCFRNRIARRTRSSGKGAATCQSTPSGGGL